MIKSVTSFQLDHSWQDLVISFIYFEKPHMYIVYGMQESHSKEEPADYFGQSFETKRKIWNTFVTEYADIDPISAH